MQDDLEKYIADESTRDPDFAAALTHAEERARLVDIAQEVIGEWVDTACKIAAATWGDDKSAQEAVSQMRHLHLAEPWHPASKLAQRFMDPHTPSTDAEGKTFCVHCGESNPEPNGYCPMRTANVGG